ncbi:hypothetical protein LTS14_002265 [Recurvomyces mirabilis]|uniref:uncharacterized protein n=1 Tax=Recurvomyces mirabilis TaxID=574656 RepID=UPI002DDF54D8|nr:hypothetical protein LTS14_002265 [Recurvomyces mirabilis]
MGNCCGSEDKNFSGEGRTLGAQPASAPARTGNASAAAPPKIGGVGRTLAGKDSSPSSGQDPKAAAARAAEVRSLSSTNIKEKTAGRSSVERRHGSGGRMERAKANTQGRGKLGKQLDAQRSQSQANALAQTARDNVASRDADAAAQARNYN